MKALKLKSSSKEDPVWGKSTCDSFSNWMWDTIIVSKEPTLLDDFMTIDWMKGDRESLYHLFEQWELVNVEITIE